MTVLVTEILGVLAAQLQATSVSECEDLPSAKTFLQSRPAGVYTCARARVRTKARASSSELTNELVEWSFHLQRLSTGLGVVDTNFNQDKLKLDTLNMATERLATTILTQWHATETTVDGMLSVLWYPLRESDDYGVAVHMCPMPQSKCLASTLLVYGEGRENARCKHTQWIEDRVPIEKHVAHLVETRGEPIHEVLLSKAGPGGDRLLLEGLITNFFVGTDGLPLNLRGGYKVEKAEAAFLNVAVKGGVLYTVDEGVLEGSTRQLVLKACSDLSIPVVLEAPKLSERDSWQAAFVTSTQKLLLLLLHLRAGHIKFLTCFVSLRRCYSCSDRCYASAVGREGWRGKNAS